MSNYENGGGIINNAEMEIHGSIRKRNRFQIGKVKIKNKNLHRPLLFAQKQNQPKWPLLLTLPRGPCIARHVKLPHNDTKQ